MGTTSVFVSLQVKGHMARMQQQQQNERVGEAVSEQLNLGSS